MKKICNFLVIALVFGAFTSCGIFKTKTKNKEQFEVKESVRISSSESEVSKGKTESKEKEVDKGEVVTEREIVTKKTSQTNSSKITIKKGDIKNGLNILLNDMGEPVIAVLDSLKGTLTLETPSSQETEETTIKERISDKRDKTKEKEENEDKDMIKQVAITAQQDRKEEYELKESKSEPSTKGMLWFWVGGGIFVLIIGIAVALWLGFRPKNLKK